jgi:hypothetical protein
MASKKKLLQMAVPIGSVSGRFLRHGYHPSMFVPTIQNCFRMTIVKAPKISMLHLL